MVRKRKPDRFLKSQADDRLHGNDQQWKDVETKTKEEAPLIAHSHICLFTTGVLLAVYVATLHPSVPGGDSGELIIAGHELGVAHPPGYPVFTLAAKLSMILFPFKSPAWRLNFLNAILSAATGGFLQLTVLKLTSDVGASLFAASLFCLSKLTWTYSVAAEVFSLNNLMISILLYVAVMFEQTAREYDESEKSKHSITRVTLLGVFMSAFALCNQHTIVLYVVIIAVWVFVVLLKLKVLSFRLAAGIFFCGVLGLVPYIYLPISSYLNIARWTWGDQTTISGILTHLLRSEYGTFDLGKDQEGLGFTAGIYLYFESSHTNLCSLGPALAIVGCICVVTYYRGKLGEGCLFVFICMLSLYVCFFAWRSNLDVSNPLLRGVVERFFMQSDIVVTLLAAVGLHVVSKLITEAILPEHLHQMTYSFTCVAALSVLGLQLQNFSECNQSDNYVVHDFAKTMLNNFPRNAVVLTKGDLPTNSLRYLYLCENVRPDVTLLDVEIMSYEWSLPKLGKFYDKLTFPGEKWHKTVGVWPDGKRSFNMKMLLDSNYNKGEIFACIGMTEKDMSWQEGYTLWPFGPCHRVVKRTETLDVKGWTQRTKNYAAEWKYPYDVFDAKSWEKVANDEMWSARINTAFFMYAESQKTQDGNLKAEMLLSAFELYSEAVKRNQPKTHASYELEKFPHYWYKNFALVCERLLYVEVKMSKAELCKLSIYNFEMYIASNPPDEDISKIHDAIANLRSRVDTYQKLDAIEDSFGRKV